MNKKRFLIVGAGFSGAVLARELAEGLDASVSVIDERSHIAGNCHTERDSATGIMVHQYGPHIFNTNREDVWNYVNRFGVMGSYTNRVKAVIRQGVFSMPINLLTINQFFGKTLSPREAEEFLHSRGDSTIGEPRNFEEQALKMLGRDLYDAFFYGYTKKQWGCEPTALPASILKRLPVRFNYDDNYYAARFQGIPIEGYTRMIENILSHPRITVECGQPYEDGMRAGFDHLFYTGSLDRYFKSVSGRLGYRTVTFEKFETDGDYQGNAVINYPGMDVPYTRIHEHKHFAPWETHDRTLFFREFSKETTECDIPYYPKRLEEDLQKLLQYRKLAQKEDGVSFLGRLGTYRYMNMDQSIGEAMILAGSLFKQQGRSVAAPHLPTPRHEDYLRSRTRTPLST
jgi:UDP-galactopyranose mutase